MNVAFSEEKLSYYWQLEKGGMGLHSLLHNWNAVSFPSESDNSFLWSIMMLKLNPCGVTNQDLEC